MPGTASGTPSRRSSAGPRLLTVADLDGLTARAGLPAGHRARIRAAAAVTGFAVTSYVADELIDWSAAPDDPLYRLAFPDDSTPGTAAAAGPARPAAPSWRRAGQQVLPGAYRARDGTVSAYLPVSGGYGITCPGARQPARGHGPALSPADAARLAGHLAGHPAPGAVVEFTGADTLRMPAAMLRAYLEPLLANRNLAAIALPTAALARWPYRLLAGPDADDTLRLLDQAAAAGTAISLIASFAHPRELEAGPAAAAAARVRGTGAAIYTTGTLAGTVNDDDATWAAMWRAQIRAGMVPHALTTQHITGPAARYRVPIARAQQIFARAYAAVAGLARTVRGPVMHGEHGTVCADGVTRAGSHQLFALRYLQAADPDLAGTPFFAAYDPRAAWLTDLKPAPGAPFPRQPGHL